MKQKYEQIQAVEVKKSQNAFYYCGRQDCPSAASLAVPSYSWWQWTHHNMYDWSPLV